MLNQILYWWDTKKETHKCNFCPPFYKMATTLVTVCHFGTTTSLIRLQVLLGHDIIEIYWMLVITKYWILYWWDTKKKRYKCNFRPPFYQIAAIMVSWLITGAPRTRLFCNIAYYIISPPTVACIHIHITCSRQFWYYTGTETHTSHTEVNVSMTRNWKSPKTEQTKSK